MQCTMNVWQWGRQALTLLVTLIAIGCQDSDSQTEQVEAEDQTPVQGVCDPGSTSEAADGCNICTCPDSGLIQELICTVMTCELYQPCLEKGCGDSCDICDPTDMTCAETLEAKVCDINGQCVNNGQLSCEIDLCADVVCEASSLLSCDGNLLLSTQSSLCDSNTGECVPNGDVISRNCNAEGLMCMDGDCVALGDAHCLPGETFDAEDECNTCECPSSGLKDEAVCTDITCPVETGLMVEAGHWSYNRFTAGVTSCEGVKDDIANALSDDKGFVLSDPMMMGFTWRIDGLPEAAICDLNDLSVSCSPLTGNIDNAFGVVLPTVIDINGRFEDETNISGTYTANIDCEGDVCITAELIYGIAFPCLFNFDFTAVVD